MKTARILVSLYDEEMKKTTERQIKQMFAVWNDKRLKIRRGLDFPEYCEECCAVWADLPAIFVEWAVVSWPAQNRFYPKPGEFELFAAPFLRRWASERAALERMATWPREDEFVQTGTVESRREFVANSLKRDVVTAENGEN